MLHSIERSIPATFAAMKVSVIGTGNAAWHFAHIIKLGGHDLLSVWGRDTAKAKAMAHEFGCALPDSPIPEVQPDLVLLAVSDEAIQGLSATASGNWLMAHVSGTVPIDFLKNERRGIIWPVQSLTAGIPVDYANVPFCVEADSAADLELLSSLPSAFGGAVYRTTHEQRNLLHLAAVFACNFSNHLYTIAERITDKAVVPFETLHPLIEFTAQRIQSISPSSAQTGPAIRKDALTVMRHLELLRDEPELANLYRYFTQLIQDTHS